MKERTTYLIGGIATDERLYRYQLAQIPGAVYLPFQKHDRGDTMETYVHKFLPLINTSRPFNIVANSMGGIMAMELIRHIQPEKVVLVSSVKSRKEMPLRLRQLKYTRLHRLLPGAGFIAGIRFGTLFVKEITGVPGRRELVIQMAKSNPPDFLYWCVHAIVNWKGADEYRKDIIHIHGSADMMFPARHIRNAVFIPGGTHNILFNHPELMTRKIMEYLE